MKAQNIIGKGATQIIGRDWVMNNSKKYKHMKDMLEYLSPKVKLYVLFVVGLSYANMGISQICTRTISNVNCPAGIPKVFVVGGGLSYNGNWIGTNFTLQSGTITENLSTGTATINITVCGDSNPGACMTITTNLSGRTTTNASPHLGGMGECLTLTGPEADWYYYTTYSGTATGSSGDLVGYSATINAQGGYFQLGTNASLYDNAFGGAGWWNGTNNASGNWSGDFNFNAGPCVPAATCTITSVTIQQVGTCTGGTYNLTGQVNFSSPPSTGTLVINVSGGGSQTLTAPFVSPISYTINGLYADGSSHTVTATFSAEPTCTGSGNYMAPANCGNVICSSNLEYPYCAGDEYTLTAQTGLTGYQWYLNGVAISGATSSSYVATMLGVYTWTATDSAGCSVQECCPIELISGNCCSIGVTCNTAPQTSYSPVNGSASVSVTGGQGNIAYLWSSGETTTSINGKAAGTYTVTVTDDFLAGCVSTCQAVISSSTSNPIVTCSKTDNTNCVAPNGTATATSTGVTYLWNNNATTSSISNLTAGNYTVTVTSTTTGCTATCQAIVLNATVNPTCNITANSQPSCANLTGGSITVNPSPAGTYTYNWSDLGSGSANRTGLTGGTYTVTVTNTTTSCTGVCQITLTTPTNCCNISAVVPQNVICYDNGTPGLSTDNRIRFSANITNTNTSLTSYNVSINGGTTITPTTNVPYGLTQFTLGPGTAGGGATFTVTVTDSATPGCTQTFQVIDPGSCNLVVECPTPQCGTATIQTNGN